MKSAWKMWTLSIVGMITSSCMLPRQEPLILPDQPPKTVSISLALPILTPMEEQQRQTKENVVVSLEVFPFSFKRKADKSHSIIREGYRDGSSGQHQIYDVYRFTETPSYDVAPSKISFRIRVVNNHERILKMEGTVVTFSVDGKDIAVSRSGYQEFLQGILTPKSEKEFQITGPAIDAIPDQSVIAISLFDVVGKMDKAGNAVEKVNFQWYFKYTLKKEVKEETITYGYSKVNWERRTCTSCGGSGAGDIVGCTTCKGRGYTTDRKGRTSKCYICGGSGLTRSSCQQCNGEGWFFARPATRKFTDIPSSGPPAAKQEELEDHHRLKNAD